MKYNYCEQVDKALGNSYSKHRTLRTCFDPGSQEWSETTMEERIAVLEKVVNSGNSLNRILLDYKITYKEMNKKHVVESLESGLIELIEYFLKNK